ncbi:phospholipid-transporting ATPase IF isoform X1 [Plutella xylostella]|uniref:phospholipid-transporting ATPase IF isoform X1 n=1 Tax=Plutella xylostella TaxID=51655 RepID=UPI0020328A8B|nr:phospholipid-transporting ATPase IF isoform X1 [Plutella xylostella]
MKGVCYLHFYNFLVGLCERSYKCIVETLCCCFLANKVSAVSDTRLIEVGAADESGKKHNKIKTSKYTLLTFLPKNLTEQFRRIVNFYFLIVTVIAIVIDSPVSPYTSIAPLSFMVMITAMKQGYEDWLRHKADNLVNKQIVEIIHKGTIKEVINAHIAPGTLVRVRRGHAVPADLVLLCSSGDGKCYVTTANLDGETNLKTLRVPPPLVGYTSDIIPQGMRIEVPNPVADLYTFYGRLEIPGRDTLPLSTDNLMLRGSRVKNTEWAIGCAVYTGEETKLALNSRYTANKFSSCELAVNSFLGFFIILLCLEIVISYALKIRFELKNHGHETYLGPQTTWPPTPSAVMQDLFSFLLLYYYIIPMSLYVTIELYKFIGALFIGWDEDLRCKETGRYAVANTSDLNEELGQIEVLFSDKTGTLTKNLMVFKACSINGHVYEERDNKLYETCGFEEPEDMFKTDIKFFFTILALCHSVQISNEEMKRLSAKLSLTSNQLISFFQKKSKIQSANGFANGNTISTNGISNNLNSSTGKVDYQASSPDEKALVEAADRFGITFLGEDGNNLVIGIADDTELYERLQLIEFTSERKRMSVVLKDKDGKIWLFCKGAESSVLPLCRNNEVIDITNRDITTFANKGLRTLAIAYREIPQEEYDIVTDGLKRVDARQDAAFLQQVSNHYRILERDLTLIGATAVEDCLQDDVAETLASLRRAGLRIWVLTGDKVETAINVAQSCAHISENDTRIYLINIEDNTKMQAQLDECKQTVNAPDYRDITLIVDGTSMAQILDTTYAPQFVDISLKCHAVLCCRLSPIQKAKIVRLIKHSPEQPITAAIGDGANDISMIQEAHVGFGIFGKEGHQAARSADFGFTKFAMIKKIILVMGHWYYQRLATLIHYFFYKNLVFGNLMLFYQYHSAFSTQSIFDSMYLTLYNLVFSSVPCLILSVTEQRWPPELLMKKPAYYKTVTKNQLMTWRYFGIWCGTATYHSLIIYVFSLLAFKHLVVSTDGKTIDLWCYGAVLFHYLLLVVNLKLWLHARYQTAVFVASVVLSVVFYVLFNWVYALVDVKFDGDILGTYTRLLASPAFWLSNVVVCVAVLLPDFCIRLYPDLMKRKAPHVGTEEVVATVSRL